MTYCTSIWTTATFITHNATKIRRVQALALHIMTGAMPSTPYITYPSDLYSWHYYLPWGGGGAAKGAERLRAYGSWSLENFAIIKGTIKTDSTINNNFMDDLNIPNTGGDHSVPTLNLARTFKVTLPVLDNTRYRNELQHVIIDSLHPDIITCYIDGSGTDQGRGVTTTRSYTKTRTKSPITALFFKQS